MNRPQQRRSGHSHMEQFRRGEGEGENHDIVLLPELLSGGSDLLGGLRADLARSIETEEFAGRGLGFDDAIGEEGEGVARSEVQGSFSVDRVGREAEGQAGFERDFIAVEVGSEMAGVGKSEGTVLGDPHTEAGDEATLLCADELLIEAYK